MDATPLNNVLAKDFFYTEDIYGHDNEAVLDTTELVRRESNDITGSMIQLDMVRITIAPILVPWRHGVAVTFGPKHRFECFRRRRAI